jgi:hypothetical protein
MPQQARNRLVLDEFMRDEVRDLEQYLDGFMKEFNRMSPCPKKHELADEIILLQQDYFILTNHYYTRQHISL